MPFASLTILISGAVILSIVYFQFSLLGLTTSAMTESDILSNLRVTLSQSSTAPHTVSVSVENKHPSTTITVLKWNSPLDPAALGLGLIFIKPAEADEPYHINSIKISRKMPPTEESLVTLGPGENVTNDVELREPIIPSKVWKGGRATVEMKGRWMAVWAGLTKDDLLKDPQKLKGVGGGQESLTGYWVSEPIEVK